jgi:hypothetical protein
VFAPLVHGGDARGSLPFTMILLTAACVMIRRLSYYRVEEVTAALHRRPLVRGELKTRRLL